MKRILLIFVLSVSLIGSIFLISCSTSGKLIKPDKLILFPPPPDTTRIQFLTRLTNSSEIMGQRGGFEKLILGDEPELSIQKPYGIAIAKNKIYICDTQIKGIVRIDLLENKFDYVIPEGFGILKKPINCFIDDNNNVYIADIDRGDIVVYDENFKYIKNIGFGLLEKPTDVFVYGSKIYIADIKKNNILIFNLGDYSYSNVLLNVPESDTAFLHQPTNIYIKNDKLYVSDIGASDVKIYELNGVLIKTIGQAGSGHGNFVRPKGIAVDNDENLYVVDAAFENVQIFNVNSELLLFFGGSYNGPGDMYLPAKVAIDYQNIDYFRQFVDDRLNLNYLIFVTNQYGPDKVSIYGAVKPK